LLNGWEQSHFGDPISAVASADPDGDGVNNLQEQAADTDPTNAVSMLKFIGTQVAGTNLVLNWQGGQAVRQIIQQSTNLMSGVWKAVYTNQPPTPVTNSFNIQTPAGSANYFRIQIAP
jgi:hypothetical protein